MRGVDSASIGTKQSGVGIEGHVERCEKVSSIVTPLTSCGALSWLKNTRSPTEYWYTLFSSSFMDNCGEINNGEGVERRAESERCVGCSHPLEQNSLTTNICHTHT